VPPVTIAVFPSNWKRLLYLNSIFTIPFFP
jgi:hypothetical protein